ncbi:MAG: hypothetical protein LBH95_06895 [Oscillospiraceae bacterium]|jgi:DNA-directed RNA polymerase specialized sigma24 family protein|nr:hypothetical protein [Oscillospiraceae bacterium]
MSDEIEEKILIEQMLRCLGTLSDYEQMLIHKHYFEGRSVSSIAKDVEVPYFTVYRRMHSIVKRLSQMMGLDGR